MPLPSPTALTAEGAAAAQQGAGEDALKINVRNPDGSVSELDLSQPDEFNAMADAGRAGLEEAPPQPSVAPPPPAAPPPPPNFAPPAPDPNNALNQKLDKLIDTMTQQQTAQQNAAKLAELASGEEGWLAAKAKAMKANDYRMQVEADRQLAAIATQRAELRAPAEQPPAAASQQQPLPGQGDVPKTHEQVRWETANAYLFSDPRYKTLGEAAVAEATRLYNAGWNPETPEFFDEMDKFVQGGGNMRKPAIDISGGVQQQPRTQGTLPGTGSPHQRPSGQVDLTPEHIQVLRDLGVSNQDKEVIQRTSQNFNRRIKSGSKKWGVEQFR